MRVTFTEKPSLTKTGKSLGTPFWRWMRWLYSRTCACPADLQHAETAKQCN